MDEKDDKKRMGSVKYAKLLEDVVSKLIVMSEKEVYEHGIKKKNNCILHISFINSKASIGCSYIRPYFV